MSLLGGVAAGLAGGVVNYFGAKRQARSQESMNAANMALQKEFAKKGIRWKVADARKAGINPLVALGAQTHSFSPQMIGGEDALGKTMQSMGQDISRAGMAAMTRQQRGVAKMTDLQIKDANLDLEFKRLRNNKLRQEMNPAMPDPNKEQTNIGGPVQKVPATVASSIMQGQVQAGQPPMYQFFKAGKNEYTVLLSEQAKNAMEDSPYEGIQLLKMVLKNWKPPFAAP